MNDNKQNRDFCLINEIDTAVKLIKKGLCELQAISDINDFYHAPILLLSTGFERLIKCLLCIIHEPYDIRKEGHDTAKLLDKLISVCDAKGYSTSFPAAGQDIKFLKTDSFFREIINLLTDFGKASRYYNLDIILDGKSRHEDPETVWKNIETRLVEEHPSLLKLSEEGKLGELYKGINIELSIIFERFARSLARLFTIGDFGDFARRMSGDTSDFRNLRDSDLGKTDWCQKIP